MIEIDTSMREGGASRRLPDADGDIYVLPAQTVNAMLARISHDDGAWPWAKRVFADVKSGS